MTGKSKRLACITLMTFFIFLLAGLFNTEKLFITAFYLLIAKLSGTMSAGIIPAGFFISIANRKDRKTNGLIYLIYLGIISLISVLISMAIGLIRACIDK